MHVIKYSNSHKDKQKNEDKKDVIVKKITSLKFSLYH